MGKGSPVRAKAPLEVDRDSLLELARGGNLYADRFACVRELLQNAADATLLRVFEEDGAAGFRTHEGSLRELRARLTPLPIAVSVERLTDAGSLRRYRIVVEDQGGGIARADVPHLQRIASSRKNPRRARLIAAMPEWMRPSGTFGIGLQSAFLVASEIVLETCTLRGEASRIVLRASDGGTIEVRGSDRRVQGTRVELVAHIPRSELRRRNEHRHEEMGGDPLGGALDPLIESAYSVARRCGTGSLVPVVLDGSRIASHFDHDHAWFDPKELVEIVLPTHDGDGVLHHARPSRAFSPATHMELRNRAHHRGLPVEDWDQGLLAGVRVTYDLHVGSARENLLVGRDVWSARGREVARTRVRNALHRRAPTLLRATDERSPSLRAWLGAHVLRTRGRDAGGAWRAIVLAGRDDARVTLGDAFERGAVSMRSEPRTEGERAGSRITLAVPGGPSAEDVPYHLLPLLDALFPVLERTEPRTVTYRRTGEDRISWAHFENVVVEQEQAFDVRPLLGVPPELALLCVPARAKDELGGEWEWRERRATMLSPWTFEKDVVRVPHVVKWVAWTARAGGPPRTRASVARALMELLERLDAPLRESRWREVAYDLDAVRAEIEEAYGLPKQRPTTRTKARKSRSAR